MKPIPLLNVRANEKCPRPKRAQLKQIPQQGYFVTGATRIVHRVICVGARGRQSCSTAGNNQLRTYRAEASVEDTTPPVVATRLDTPLPAANGSRATSR